MKFSCLSFCHQSISQNIGYCFASLCYILVAVMCRVLELQLLMSSRWLLYVVFFLSFFLRFAFLFFHHLLLLWRLKFFVSKLQAHSAKAKKYYTTHQTLSRFTTIFSLIDDIASLSLVYVYASRILQRHCYYNFFFLSPVLKVFVFLSSSSFFRGLCFCSYFCESGD